MEAVVDLFGEKMRAELAEALYDADARLCLGEARTWGVGRYDMYCQSAPHQYDSVTQIQGNTYERLAHVAMRFIQNRAGS